MKKKLFVALVLALCLLLSGCADGAITAREARSGVVRVLVTKRADLYSPTGEYLETRNSYGVGSAFGVGDAGEETDVFVTNRHVVTSEPGIMQLESGELVLAVYETTGVYLVLDNFAYNLSTNELDTSRTVPCTVIYAGNEEEEDVAVLRASEPVPGRVALALQAEESSLREEDPVTALGYPFLSDEATNEGYLLATIDDMTVSPGYAMRFYEAQDVLADTGTGRVIQMSCVINGGNSGGPLFNEYGQVIGIVSAKLSGSSNSEATVEGLGFAIPINDVSSMIQDIMTNGYVSNRAYLGATIGSLNASMAQQYRYDITEGAFVYSVEDGGPADQAGLQLGDVITAIDDTEITSLDDLTAARKSYSAGDTCTLTVYRQGETLTLNLAWGTTPADQQAESQSSQQDSGQNGGYINPNDLYNYFFG